MSHHFSGLNLTFPGGDARLDFTDLYAFPGDPGKSIIVFNVHPSIGVNPPGPTTAEPFAPEALYEIRIDTNRDAVADITYRVRFAFSSAGAQIATLSRIEGMQAARVSDSDEVIIDGAPVSTGPAARVTQACGYRLFVGWRSDPFFFDAKGAQNNFTFTGEDFFDGKDVCSMVLEIPSSDLGMSEVGVWARTLVRAAGVDRGWIQVDRGARPLQLTFLVGEQNEAYRAGEPADDARFVAVFAHALEHTGGYVPEEATRLAGTLLLDILRYDLTRPASFSDNGRALSDDAADIFLSIVTNGKVTADGVGPHGDLLAEFPYLGPPHDSTVPRKEIV